MEKRTSADSDLEWTIVLILYLKYMKVIQREKAPVAIVFMGFVLLFFKRVPDSLLLCPVPVDSGLCFFSMTLRSRRSWEVWDMTSEKHNFEGSSWRECVCGRIQYSEATMLRNEWHIEGQMLSAWQPWMGSLISQSLPPYPLSLFHTPDFLSLWRCCPKVSGSIEGQILKWVVHSMGPPLTCCPRVLPFPLTKWFFF